MAGHASGVTHVVLMGDIVGSEKTSSTEHLHAALNNVVDEANERRSASILSPLTITLGDEFQGVITSLRDGAIIARELRLQLMVDDIDCRFVIGTVELKTSLNRDRAWNMMGLGLAQAREKLNEKKTDTLYRFSLPGEERTEALLDAIGIGITSTERRWTRTQLHDIAESLDGRSALEIARIRNVSVHSVYKAKSNGEFDAYVLQWGAMLSALDALDSKRAAP